MKVIVREVRSYENRFVIVKQGDDYCAIDYKYIDEEGKLTKALNGLQMHCAKTLKDCISNARFYSEVMHYVNADKMPVEEALNIMIFKQKEGII